MALSPSTLSSGIQAITAAFPADAAAAGSAWADAYAAYAASAQSPMGGIPVTLVAAKATLATALAGAFSGVVPATTAAAMATAFVAFWLTPPVVFVGTPPGAVTVAIPGALAAALVAAWAANTAGKLSVSDSADSIATAIDAWTRTVIVTHPTPVPIVGPIT